jgi:protein SCO1/2
MMRVAAAFIVLLALFGCSDDAAKPLSEPGEKLYTVRGVILGRDQSANSLHMDHESIPGFMEAMKMDYTVRGADVASLPANGSRIEAKLHVTSRSYWITDVRKVP